MIAASAAYTMGEAAGTAATLANRAAASVQSVPTTLRGKGCSATISGLVLLIDRGPHSIMANSHARREPKRTTFNSSRRILSISGWKKSWMSQTFCRPNSRCIDVRIAKLRLSMKSTRKLVLRCFWFGVKANGI